MQYGVDVFPYERVKRKNEQSKKRGVDLKRVYELIGFFTISVLISRVNLINNMVPFGIAFLMAIALSKNDFEIYFIASCGAIIGYISNYTILKDYLGMYLLLICMELLLYYFLREVRGKKFLILSLGCSFAIMCSYYVLIMRYSFFISSISAISQIGCIFPLYYIVSYAIKSLKYINTKHLFSSEEIIALGTTLGLAIAGTRGFSIYGVSLMNICSLSLIIGVAYLKGPETGAAMGVAIGTISGLSSTHMILYIGIYGTCGLISGIFRETGKYFVSLAFIVSFLIVKFYSGLGNDFKIIESIIVAGAFCAIPKAFLDKLSLEFDVERKNEAITGNSVDRIKEIYSSKIMEYSGILVDMSETLKNINDNDKLLMKNKSTALVQNLADRVCTECSMRSSCWNKEYYYTFNAIEELLGGALKDKAKIPKELDRKCVRRREILKEAEEIVNHHVINETRHDSIRDGRQMLSSEIENIASSLEEMSSHIKENFNFDSETEYAVRRVLNKNSIIFNDISCIRDKNNRTRISLELKSCRGQQKCVKEILPLINGALKTPMCISEEGCKININTNSCIMEFQEAPMYHMSTYVAKKNKEGEKCSGDSFSFGEMKDGTYMVLLSDGMGTGPIAKQESAAAILLMEKVTAAGFKNISAINTVNTLMTLKYFHEEKFSTLDLCSVDLYNGQAEFLKVGAVASFIKKGEKVQVIDSKTLPMGVLDRIDIERSTEKLNSGDILVMVSDGVLDYDSKSLLKYDWVVSYLEECTKLNPRDIAEELLGIGEKLYGGKSQDDMTVVVSKVYKLY